LEQKRDVIKQILVWRLSHEKSYVDIPNRIFNMAFGNSFFERYLLSSRESNYPKGNWTIAFWAKVQKPQSDMEREQTYRYINLLHRS
jgi:hypothetical protein